MKFCPSCHNVLYGIDEDADSTGKKFAVLQCRRCPYKEPVSQDNPVLYEHSLREDKTGRLAVNPYLKDSPVLPHFKEIICPNAECPSKSGAPPDVVGVKIDPVTVTWMYQCVNCGQSWKQNAGAS
jgi:DNA-directed RNA polymerase subunit M/transcription elongation factor TFIIS